MAFDALAAVPVTAAARLGTAGATIAAAIVALGDLNALTGRLGGGGRDGGENRGCDQQSSKRVLHLGLLQYPIRHPADREDESKVTGGKMISG